MRSLWFKWLANRSLAVGWRRERDLNPRSRFKRDTRLAGEPLRPTRASLRFFDALRIALSAYRLLLAVRGGECGQLRSLRASLAKGFSFVILPSRNQF